MASTIIRNATLINEGKTFSSDVLIEDGLISKIDKNIFSNKNYQEINEDIIPLLKLLEILNQVHFFFSFTLIRQNHFFS